VVLDALKRWVWRLVVRLHGDVRVAALLRALSVVGMIGGMVGFMIGINPIFAAIVMARGLVAGTTLLKVGILGLAVYSASYAYYNATTPKFLTDDGLIRL
jgi:hypothetical protein